MKTKNQINLKKNLYSIYNRKSLLPVQDYLELLKQVNHLLETEPDDCRPHDGTGLSGGLIYLNSGLTTIIVPDLHGRMDFIITLLFSKQLEAELRMVRNELQIVCVGDGFHGEARVIERWFQAYNEYLSGYRYTRNMDEEMIESLGVMEMVVAIKSAYPRMFHFLKGNHENIANEHGGGNYPFTKFVEEGAMVAAYVQKFLGKTFLKEYYRFEKNLPLLAVGKNFLVSHAEPRKIFQPSEVVEYRTNGSVVEGLTWTDNDSASPGSVKKMIECYIEKTNRKKAYYFGGHRPIPGLFGTRADGRYVQIHNPNKFVLAVIPDKDEIDLRRDIMELKTL